MALRGTHNCPIEIEDVETISPPKKKKRKVEEITIKEDDIIFIENTSETPKESRKKFKKESKRRKTSKDYQYASQRSVRALHEKFASLENRLESLETCLARVSQVFLATSHGLDPCKDEEESSGYNEPALEVQNEENICEDASENVNATPELESPSDTLTSHDGLASGNGTENNEPAAVDESMQQNNCQNGAKVNECSQITEFESNNTATTVENVQHRSRQNSTEVSATNEVSHLNNFESNDASSSIDNIGQRNNPNDTEALVMSEVSHVNEFDNHEHSATIENIQQISQLNDADTSVINQSSHFETSTSEPLQETREQVQSTNHNGKSSAEHGDGQHSPLNFVIKREVDLHRDDQGRVLMFLSCAFKKLYKPVPGIAATSGVYIGDEFQNEYNFVSNRKMVDVKTEAEIRAVLFGIELVKSLYREASGAVCLMVISSCQPLVKLMKERAFSLVYPKFYSCSCDIVECNHSTTRWSSTHPTWSNQRDLLPLLLMTLKGLKVHWCTVDRISDEEKKILERYSIVVQASLNEHFAQHKNRLT
ncbi:uncharacterized protein LOC117644060 [Thrips palmi]|uniref:Uncharacterized protein LOC117644060 n=1 Tax=Thrips palmi TaxID=161013 RepID=A0A6P8YPG2_THRPL|nr:uncharacterized protein LOC117644060 [Thrips palmi]